MDISKASNFERYVFDLVSRNPERMQELWSDLKEKGVLDISEAAEFVRLREDVFIAGSSTHADRLKTIRDMEKRYGILIDPHTADGVTVGLLNREEGTTLIALETAHAAKFASTIREALGTEPPVPASFAQLLELPERFEVMDADVVALKRYIVKNCV